MHRVLSRSLVFLHVVLRYVYDIQIVSKGAELQIFFYINFSFLDDISKYIFEWLSVISQSAVLLVSH